MATSASAATESKADKTDISREIASELAQIRQDVAALGKTLGQYGKARIGALPDLATESTEEALENARLALKEIRREMNAIEAGLEKRVAEHPAQSLLIALGLGFLVAFLIRR
ncbi:MAG: hypothetical protein WBN04_01985 [Paracoccaceae bacterium]